MKLESILKGVECSVRGSADIEIKDLANDSRAVKNGDMFFCISGFETDGHKYAKSAVEKGAVCIVVTEYQDIDGVTQVLVKNDRRAMAACSANFFGHPSKKMKMIGLTGTNGKTTSTYMIKSIAEKAGYKAGLIGTIQNMIGEKELHTERTTPESLELQRLLRQMSDEGCGMAVMEVSSHSLFLDRTYGIEFDAGVFTNLTQDHLDFHKTFENYINAKAMLFSQSKASVINADDDCASAMISAAKGEVITYGCKSKADIAADNIEMSAKGTTYTARAKGAQLNIHVGIPGMFTVYNSLCAIGACKAIGISDGDIEAGLAGMRGVNGRFEILPSGGDYTVILDYAHTPDSLENTLKTINEFAKHRVVTVFGCGGNRDKGKRPLMGEIAAKNSGFTIVTTDNPRFETPADIMKDIVAGIPENSSYITIENRREAIKYAIENALAGDIILLAGKGHETYQEICGVKHDFDEKVVVAQIIEELKAKDGEKQNA